MLFFGVSQHLEHFRQDPPNKWLLEGIATGEQVAFEAGQKTTTLEVRKSHEP